MVVRRRGVPPQPTLEGDIVRLAAASAMSRTRADREDRG